ncbi:MAG: response regulator [Spirochaetales bacterium]|nr:response regulator [Spirochaetales bacterium]
MAKILIIEDEAIIAKDIQLRLKKLGYEITAIADNKMKALAITETDVPDLALVDIMLKGKEEGIEAALEIHSLYDVPIIYLTSYSDEQTLEKAKVAEPFGYLLKPFVEKELVSSIEMALYKHKMELQLRKNEAWLNTSLSSIHDMVIAVDNDAQLTFVNPAAEELTGIKLSDCINMNFDDIFPLLYEKNHELQKNWLRKVLDQNKSYTLDGNSLLKLRNGEFRPVDGSAAPIKDKKGKTNGVIIVLRDVYEDRKAEEELKQSYIKLQNSLEGTINAMAKVVEIRDPFTAGHQKRVASLAFLIGHELGYSENDMLGLRLAAAIHDIGKIYIPAEILSKTGKLNQLEMSMVRTHPEIGFDILKDIDFPWPIAESVYQHHEFLDGSGYPQGIKGKEISECARIIRIADVVEAMSSHRPYRPAFSVSEAVEEIRAKRDILYDPEIVDICIKLYDTGELERLLNPK